MHQHEKWHRNLELEPIGDVNSKTEVKNTVEGITSRLDEADNQINELENKVEKTPNQINNYEKLKKIRVV